MFFCHWTYFRPWATTNIYFYHLKALLIFISYKAHVDLINIMMPLFRFWFVMDVPVNHFGKQWLRWRGASNSVLYNEIFFYNCFDNLNFIGLLYSQDNFLYLKVNWIRALLTNIHILSIFVGNNSLQNYTWCILI